MSALALSTGFHRQLSLGIYPGVNISCLHTSPITSGLLQSSASIHSIKSCAKVRLQNTCANLTVFWTEILDSFGISHVIPWKISHAHSYQRQPRSFSILLIRFSLFTTPPAFFFNEAAWLTAMVRAYHFSSCQHCGHLCPSMSHGLLFAWRPTGSIYLNAPPPPCTALPPPILLFLSSEKGNLHRVTFCRRIWWYERWPCKESVLYQRAPNTPHPCNENIVCVWVTIWLRL